MSAGANCGSRGSFSVAHGVDGFSPKGTDCLAELLPLPTLFRPLLLRGLLLLRAGKNDDTKSAGGLSVLGAM